MIGQITMLNTAQVSSGNEFPVLLKKWRKYRKVSQLDFSLDAGISQKHLSFLESGRAKPSREMVLTLSETLDLPLRERNQLLHAAGFAKVYRQTSLADKDMQVVQDALRMTLEHHEPYPALVVDRNWNLLIANEASLRLIGLLGEPEEVWKRVDPSGKKNVYRMTFSESGMRPLIANWKELSQHLLLRLQREQAADPENEVLNELLAEIESDIRTHSSGQALADIEGQSDQPIAPILPTHFQVGGQSLKMFSMISAFGTALDVTAEEIKVETFFPADDFTKQFFHMLAKQSHH